MSAIIINLRDDPCVLTLSKPVDLAGVAYENITLTEPTVAQVEQADTKLTAHASNIALVASVAKIPEAVVRLMVYSDFKRAVDYLKNFLTGGQGIGEN